MSTVSQGGQFSAEELADVAFTEFSDEVSRVIAQHWSWTSGSAPGATPQGVADAFLGSDAAQVLKQGMLTRFEALNKHRVTEQADRQVAADRANVLLGNGSDHAADTDHTEFSQGEGSASSSKQKKKKARQVLGTPEDLTMGGHGYFSSHEQGEVSDSNL